MGPHLYRNLVPPQNSQSSYCTFVYANISGSYPLILIWVCTLFLPAIAFYSLPLIEKVKPSVKTVKVWTHEAAVALQDCFQCTDWHIYKEAATQQSFINIERYTKTVALYISKCFYYVMIIKTQNPKQKASMNGEVRALTRDKKAAFQAGVKIAYNAI